MTSIGNDIIALNAINRERTRDPRFYGKILTSDELLLFREDLHALDTFVWLLWSVKESVYKCHKRLLPDLVFAPHGVILKQLDYHMGANIAFGQKPYEQQLFEQQSFEQQSFEQQSCEQKSFEQQSFEWLVPTIKCHASGTACSGSEIFYFRSIITDEFIFTVVATTEDFAGVHCGIRIINDHSQAQQSAGVREFALRKIIELIPHSNPPEFIKSSAGYPVLESGGVLLPILVSFSHHEEYLGYAFKM